LNKEDDLPYTQIKKGFDPNAYDLMKRVAYDFQNPTTEERYSTSRHMVVVFQNCNKTASTQP